MLTRGAEGLVMAVIAGAPAAAQHHRPGEVIGGENAAQDTGPLAP